MRWSATIPALLLAAASVQAVPTFESGVGSANVEFFQPEKLSDLSDFDEFLASRSLGKREKDCINLRDNVKPKDCRAALSTNGFRGAFFYDDNKNSYVKKDTVLSRDAVVVEITDAETAGKGKFTCDHILELNILKSIVNLDGGMCDKAAEMEDQVAAKAKLDKVRKIVNRPQNLVFFKSSLENIKTKNTQQFQGEPVLSTGSTDLTYLVMYNYLEKTLSKTMQTAKLLDDAIAAEFPGAATGVEKLWGEYIAFTKLKAAKARSDAQKDIDKKKKDAEEKAKQAAARKAACGAPPAKPPSRPGSPAPGGAGKRRRAARSVNYISSLERRAAARRPAARGAAKSGPHAPAAPSCPLPNQQKKVVPRKNMKTKPPPKKTPRPVQNKPKPRAVKPKKTVPRPKNRPRRAPGKAKPKKRVTPKKKPKKVPKPPKKPKGKPRPRRRK